MPVTPGQILTTIFPGYAPRVNGGTYDRSFSLRKSLWVQLTTIQAVLNARLLSLNADPEVLMSQK
ncbi:hypothetical protein EXT66_09355 [Pectobacterium carotovorum subsp. carotovorum]|nr:hypothetical protein [Pectobacterium carotovorum subsp. carotovorum]ULS47325.1 hypothetical protein F9W95_17910 [Pectobacterium carotovorum]MCL6338700.1 hypothetical protein [Pectobacterium carotovorum subsp. carotovorum]MCL6342589.1 hypothetical protein [Pectobacterium carotovorum subsp. carotovorum]MCL6347036.1 hypothetical protein [Pectobacterium carotovorum subsp. carotovorum]